MESTTNMGLSADDQWALAIDAQTEKFLELKQKLTYFLVTASAVTIAFMANVVVNHLRSHGHFTLTTAETSLVIASALAGLVTAGLALISLHFDHRSWRMHIKSRYERKSFETLPAVEQCRWESFNRIARSSLRGAFVSLFLQIAVAVAFFVVLFQ